MSPVRGFRAPNAKAISWTIRTGILAFVLVGVFPPWMFRIGLSDIHVERSAGHHLILSPPAPDPNQRFAFRTSVHLDWPLLLLEWLILGGVIGGALAWQFTRTRGSDGQTHSDEQSNKQAVTGRTPVHAGTGKSLLSGFLAAFKNCTPPLQVRWPVVLAVPLCLLLLEVIVCIESAEWVALAVSLCLQLSIGGIVWWLHRAASSAGLRANPDALQLLDALIGMRPSEGYTEEQGLGAIRAFKNYLDRQSPGCQQESTENPSPVEDDAPKHTGKPRQSSEKETGIPRTVVKASDLTSKEKEQVAVALEEAREYDLKRSTEKIDSLPNLTPKHDERFSALLTGAVSGEVPVYFAAVPLSICVPFDPDYRPDLHPVGEQAICQMADAGSRGQFQKLFVYQRGKWFVVSDDYITLFAALRGQPDYLPCWVLGKPDGDLVRDVQGPITSEDVPKLLGWAV